MKKGVFLLLFLVSCMQIEHSESIIPGPDSCAADVTCKHLTPATYTIGSFNIQTFGKAKRSKADIMNVILDVVDDFDIVAVQEVRDASLETVPFLRQRLDAYNHSDFAHVESPRLGRSSGKEQYVFLYDVDSVVFLNKSYVFDDVQDWFERPPHVACFMIDDIDLCLVNVHIKPEDAASEISHLADVVADVKDRYGEDDVVVLGDFNADGQYYDESSPLITGFQTVTTNDFDTTVARSSNTYDRIVLGGSLPPLFARAGVYRFDSVRGLTAESAKAVSDHYPVYVLLTSD